MSVTLSFNLLKCHRFSAKNSICPERQHTRRLRRHILTHRSWHFVTRVRKRERYVENRLEDGNRNSSKPKRIFTNSHGDFVSKQVNRLKELGPAGMVSYGLLNSCYYTCSYIYCLHKSNLATRRQFIELAVVVWTGSQLTKAFRMSVAIAITPFISNLLRWLEQRYAVTRIKATWMSIFAMLLISSLCAYISFLLQSS